MIAIAAHGAATDAATAIEVAIDAVDRLWGGAARADLPAIVAHGPQPTVRA